MTKSIARRPIIAVCALVALAGCTGSASIPRSTPAERLSGTSRAEQDRQRKDLLYISYYEDEFVGIYTYPGLKPVARIVNAGETLGLCADALGDVFVGSGGEIREYKHGATTPIATLQDGKRYAWACSVDPTTGDLAVASTASPSGNNGDIAVYRGARGAPRAYRSRLFKGYFGCGYDASGNLYVTGFGANASAPTLLAVLSKGSSTLKLITPSHTPLGEADVQWDGAHVAVSSPDEREIVQFHVDGKIAKEVGETPLGGDSTEVDQFSFPALGVSGQPATQVIGTSDEFGEFMIWNYPAGGNPVKTLDTNYGEALSAVVSVSPP